MQKENPAQISTQFATVESIDDMETRLNNSVQK
jgi:hypothetical protein